MGNIATPMIPRNTTVPTSKTEVFSTASDNQTQVQIVVTQGERPMSADNKTLGTFTLDGIPPAPRGVPQVEVTFDMDASGILTVTAKDKATGKTQNIKITGAVGLSDDEVKRMQAEDEKKADLVKTKNNADAMVATAEKAIKDAGDKAPADVKEKVEEKIKKVKEVAAKEDASKEDIENVTKDLSDTLSQIGQAMYQKTEPSSAKASEGQGEEKKDGEDKKKDEKVEEGEVVE
jgi:molecular chaperone DnaK